MMRSIGGIAAALFATVVLTAPVRADERNAHLLRAGALARAGKCDEALALLAQTGATGARAALLRGQCHIEGKRWAEAVTALDEAQRAQPGMPEAQLPLLIARYQSGDLVGARQALDAMPPSAQQRAEYHLYRGLLLLESADNAGAGAAFDRARELAPGEMAPVAAYYSGVAWLSAKDRARADAAFDRAIALAPGSELAKQAEAARKGLTGAPLARWGFVRVGAEWDSNVVLRGEGVDLDSDISNERDGRAVWVAHAGAELFRRGAWSGGVSGTYYGSAHFDLTDFDEHHPTVSPWIDYRVDETTLCRLRYDVGYAWIDGEEFLLDQQLAPTLYKDWGDAGRSQFSARVSHLDFKFPLVDVPAPPSPPGLDESEYRDRDGWGWGLTAQHAFPLAKESELYLGVSYLGFAADGREYDYQGGEVFVGGQTLLPFEIEARAVGGVGWLPFAHRSSYQDPPGSGLFEADDREDVTWRARVEIERELGAGFSLLARYRYQNRWSNVDVFDYDRHVVGLYVTYSFGR
jgi:tetratricopeptide (TPR) repeat protein